MRPLAVMVPDCWAFARQLHVDGFGMSPVRAEVAAAILELLQMFDAMCATGSGHSSHAKRQRHLYVQTHMHTFKMNYTSTVLFEL